MCSTVAREMLNLRAAPFNSIEEDYPDLVAIDSQGTPTSNATDFCEHQPISILLRPMLTIRKPSGSVRR